MCTQSCGSTHPNNVCGSEDCLYLDVWRPSNFTGLLPVLLLIYGGGFTAGSSNLYNGTGLVSRDVIFVAFNYRVGTFGKLYV